MIRMYGVGPEDTPLTDELNAEMDEETSNGNDQ